jgi:hypothetical protein
MIRKTKELVELKYTIASYDAKIDFTVILIRSWSNLGSRQLLYVELGKEEGCNTSTFQDQLILISKVWYRIFDQQTYWFAIWSKPDIHIRILRCISTKR